MTGTFAPDRIDQPLHVSILPGRARGAIGRSPMPIARTRRTYTGLNAASRSRMLIPYSPLAPESDVASRVDRVLRRHR